MKNFIDQHWYKVLVLLGIIVIIVSLDAIDRSITYQTTMQEYFLKRQDTNVGGLIEYVEQFDGSTTTQR